MARTIGTMLNSRQPQIVNGPEILNKFVGESEANIRKLFGAAEEEQKRVSSWQLLKMDFFQLCPQWKTFERNGNCKHTSLVSLLFALIESKDHVHGNLDQDI